MPRQHSPYPSSEDMSMPRPPSVRISISGVHSYDFGITPQFTPVVPRRRRQPQRKSGLSLLLQAAQQHGITHPKDGYWVMLPKEFDAILALEHKAVAQVVLEILRQTIGKVGDGQDGRQEWATISYRHFARAGLMSLSQAQFGIREALTKRYIQRRHSGARRFEYSIRWKGTN
jgi:hypothetical protein